MKFFNVILSVTALATVAQSHNRGPAPSLRSFTSGIDTDPSGSDAAIIIALADDVAKKNYNIETLENDFQAANDKTHTFEKNNGSLATAKNILLETEKKTKKQNSKTQDNEKKCRRQCKTEEDSDPAASLSHTSNLRAIVKSVGGIVPDPTGSDASTTAAAEPETNQQKKDREKREKRQEEKEDKEVLKVCIRDCVKEQREPPTAPFLETEKKTKKQNSKTQDNEKKCRRQCKTEEDSAPAASLSHTSNLRAVVKSVGGIVTDPTGSDASITAVAEPETNQQKKDREKREKRQEEKEDKEVLKVCIRDCLAEQREPPTAPTFFS